MCKKTLIPIIRKETLMPGKQENQFGWLDLE